MVESLTKVWDWFDGKKMILGGILLVIGAAPHLPALVGIVAVDLVMYFGGALAGGGLVHKIQKSAPK